jgi:hypothetical protein
MTARVDGASRPHQRRCPVSDAPRPAQAEEVPKMSTTMPLTHERRGTRVALVLIELLIGANAVWGGIMLMTDSWNLGHGWLDNTFFDSWFLPGVALLVIIGGTQLAAAVTLLARRPYAPAVSLAAGWVLFGWIIMQLAWLQVFHPVMQPAMLAAGFLIIALAWRLSSVRPGGRAV